MGVKVKKICNMESKHIGSHVLPPMTCHNMWLKLLVRHVHKRSTSIGFLVAPRLPTSHNASPRGGLPFCVVSFANVHVWIYLDSRGTELILYSGASFIFAFFLWWGSQCNRSTVVLFFYEMNT